MVSVRLPEVCFERRDARFNEVQAMNDSAAQAQVAATITAALIRAGHFTRGDDGRETAQHAVMLLEAVLSEMRRAHIADAETRD